MKKIKVLHFSTGLQIGGAEMMLLKTLPRMSGQFENIVCSITGGEIGEKLSLEKIKVFNFDLKKWQFFRIAKALNQIIKKEKPDVLVTYLIQADLIGRILGRIFGIKKIISSKRGSTLRFKSIELFDRLTDFMVTKYICVSEDIKKEMISYWKFPKKKIIVVPNGVVLDSFNIKINVKNKKEALGINEDDFVLTYTANLKEGKGHDYLLEAFATIIEKFPRIKLLLIGANQGKQKELELLAKKLSVNSKVFFLGYRNDVLELLKITDIFVFPSLSEGMSNALLESMAARCAIVASDIAPNKELIENEKEGLLFKVGDVNDLKRKLMYLIHNKKLILKYQNNAYKKIEDEFSINKTVEKLEYIYSSVSTS